MANKWDDGQVLTPENVEEAATLLREKLGKGEFILIVVKENMHNKLVLPVVKRHVCLGYECSEDRRPVENMITVSKDSKTLEINTTEKMWQIRPKRILASSVYPHLVIADDYIVISTYKWENDVNRVLERSTIIL